MHRPCICKKVTSSPAGLFLYQWLRLTLAYLHKDNLGHNCAFPFDHVAIHKVSTCNFLKLTHKLCINTKRPGVKNVKISKKKSTQRSSYDLSQKVHRFDMLVANENIWGAGLRSEYSWVPFLQSPMEQKNSSTLYFKFHFWHLPLIFMSSYQVNHWALG